MGVVAHTPSSGTLAMEIRSVDQEFRATVICIENLKLAWDSLRL